MELKNPKSIVIKNQYYPNGLTEEQIFNYYMDNKSKILEYNENRYVMFFVAVDLNQIVVKRKINNNFIKLTKSNYEKIINGRIISIHSIMNKKENQGIIDIDHCNSNCPFITLEIVNYLESLLNSNQKLLIQFTGKKSFHIIVKFTNSFNINKVRSYLMDILQLFSKKYDVGMTTKTSNRPKLDLSSNKVNGAFISPYSLSTYGLVSDFVTKKSLQNFNPKIFKI